MARTHFVDGRPVERFTVREFIGEMMKFDGDRYVDVAEDLPFSHAQNSNGNTVRLFGEGSDVSEFDSQVRIMELEDEVNSLKTLNGVIMSQLSELKRATGGPLPI